MEKFCSDCKQYEQGISSTEVGLCHARTDLLSMDAPVFGVMVYGNQLIRKCEFFEWSAESIQEISA